MFSQATESLFGLILAEHNLTRAAHPASELAHKLYGARIAEVIESINDSYDEEA